MEEKIEFMFNYLKNKYPEDFCSFAEETSCDYRSNLVDCVTCKKKLCASHRIMCSNYIFCEHYNLIIHYACSTCIRYYHDHFMCQKCIEKINA